MARTLEANRARLIAWMKQHAERWKPTDGPFTFELATDVGSYPGDTLLTIHYHPYLSESEGGEGENRNEKSAESLGAELLECANDYATEQTLVTRFLVLDRMGGKFNFSVIPDKSHELDDDSFREPANDHGLMYQTMRHQEATLRLALSTMEVQLEQNRRLIDAQRAEIDMLYKDRRDGMKVYEELISQRHVRDMEIRQIENQEKRMERAGDMLAPMIPLVANKLLGTKLLPEGESAPFQLLKTVFTSVDKAQMGKILEALEPPQRLALVELLQFFYKAQEEEEKKKHPGNAAAAKDEDDAAE